MISATLSFLSARFKLAESYFKYDANQVSCTDMFYLDLHLKLRKLNQNLCLIDIEILKMRLSHYIASESEHSYKRSYKVFL